MTTFIPGIAISPRRQRLIDGMDIRGFQIEQYDLAVLARLWAGTTCLNH